MSEYRDWYVGMRVVCIRRGRWAAHDGGKLTTRMPEAGEVFTISAFDFDAEEGIMFIGLAEYSQDHGFEARAFRPVQPRQTDIAIFTAMLKPSKADA